MLKMEPFYILDSVGVFSTVCVSDIKQHILCVFKREILSMILKSFYCVKWVRCETSPTGLWSAGSLVFPVSLATHSTGDWEQISLRVFFSFYYFIL